MAVLAGMIAAFCLNYLFIEDILIPDPCYYHERATNVLFDVFYRTDSVDGGHPFPTLLNFVCTVFIGGLVGWFVLQSFRKGWLCRGRPDLPA
jgi:hypothetical protein